MTVSLVTFRIRTDQKGFKCKCLLIWGQFQKDSPNLELFRSYLKLKASPMLGPVTRPNWR